ncbi:MAG TPA: nucleotidyl transferase AbiEii/AbiGii toxin family protein [Deltaproteobacteria bacterium]|nr:nucleotidyl transferase AbiEii/AbiGii toxin family protein [Deltaproteobacteria bacterium]
MIFQNALLEWRNFAPFADDAQVEQDLILSAILVRIYQDDLLRQKLAFRGGTCLYKLFFKTPLRYSEDLDFVQVSPEKIGPTIKALREALRDIFDEDAKWNQKQGSYQLFYSFIPLGQTERRRIKLEINTREHGAFAGYQNKAFNLESQWRSGKSSITTFSLEEILATKLRALYQRRKGRDLYDLWMSRSLHPNWEKVVEVFLSYMKQGGHKIHREAFEQNLENKFQDSRFKGDITPLLVQADTYNPEAATLFVKKEILSLLPLSKKVQKRMKRKPG